MQTVLMLLRVSTVLSLGTAILRRRLHGDRVRILNLHPGVNVEHSTYLHGLSSVSVYMVRLLNTNPFG